MGSVLTGEAGAGKTRVLRELVERLGRAGRSATLVVASESSRAVPLGPFLRLLDADAGALTERRSLRDGSDLLRQAARIRELLLTRSNPVVAIDDANLLDAASAGLLHQLATAGATVLCSVRAGERVHDALAALWRDGLLVTTEIPLLTEDQSRTLIGVLLGGPVDHAASRNIFQYTRGNPLLVRETVRIARDRGALTQTHGIWTRTASLPASPTATSLLVQSLLSLTEEQRRAAELLALADPLRLDIAELLSGTATWEALEVAGVLALDPSSLAVVRLAHPLYRDALLGGVEEEHLRPHYRDLVDAVSTIPDSQLGAQQRMALAHWRLRLGEIDDVDEILGYAELAHTADPRLANRFVAAARARAATVPEMLRLANVLTHQHRVDDAERVLDRIDLSALPDAARAGAVLIRSFLLAMPGQRPLEALELLDELIAEVGPSPDALAVRATALWLSGQVDKSIKLAGAVFSDENAPAEARAQAGLTLSSALLFFADDRKTLSATFDRLPPLLDAAAAGLPEGRESLALVQNGRLTILDLDPVAAIGEGQPLYLAAMQRGDDGVRTQYGHMMGWAHAHAGGVQRGVELIQEAMAVDGLWSGAKRPWYSTSWVQTLVLAGRQEQAEAALMAFRGIRRAPLYDIDLALAEAAVQAGQQDFTAAVVTLRAAAGAAYPTGQRVFARVAWYTAVRYGDIEAARELLPRLPTSGTTLDAAMRDHSRALITKDAGRLLHIARVLEKLQLRWYAIETLAHAVELSLDMGLTEVASAAWERLARLRKEHPELRSPYVTALPARLLTARELEVASRAAAGDADERIASQLSISTRTVQTHLHRSYAKLLAGGRSDLVDRLGW